MYFKLVHRRLRKSSHINSLAVLHCQNKKGSPSINDFERHYLVIQSNTEFLFQISKTLREELCFYCICEIMFCLQFDFFVLMEQILQFKLKENTIYDQFATNIVQKFHMKKEIAAQLLQQHCKRLDSKVFLDNSIHEKPWYQRFSERYVDGLCLMGLLVLHFLSFGLKAVLSRVHLQCKNHFSSLPAPLLIKQYFYICQLVRLACCSRTKLMFQPQGILLFLLASLHSLGRDIS